ncbi:hypothetical protein [Methylorubrum extorquens]|uniref:hypothetical protein n=1 Tax=Methylorubrum extorquens TaxID=408 RepID=UPI001EE5AEF5|nr:hypothetical protein [Methylorubrum extorquens]MCG5244748.1 hypothetical protein [Methylorubrum extorquens]
METWAEIHADLELPSYGMVCAAAITSGEHPHLGAVVAVQMPDGIVIATELPFADEIDRQLAGQEDEIKAIASAATSHTRRPAQPSIADVLRANGITPRLPHIVDGIDVDDLAELDRI